jgi:hypothetical protein
LLVFQTSYKAPVNQIYVGAENYKAVGFQKFVGAFEEKLDT